MRARISIYGRSFYPVYTHQKPQPKPSLNPKFKEEVAEAIQPQGVWNPIKTPSTSPLQTRPISGFLRWGWPSQAPPSNMKFQDFLQFGICLDFRLLPLNLPSPALPAPPAPPAPPPPLACLRSADVFIEDCLRAQDLGTFP